MAVSEQGGGRGLEPEAHSRRLEVKGPQGLVSLRRICSMY